MKVDKLIEILSELPQNQELKIVGIVNADELPKGDEWSEDEDIRDVESNEFDVFQEDGGNLVIQFFMN
ncbi:hypothetical protein KIH86_13960 [Paenibacillus sp. HN-1]|uniref:hypothetical protein n=1 Tax=Paenibacillus TaxID=44249 RepID=UPI001CA830AC|nr:MULTISPECIES: hypothetical protein [Paenibacillus]MBY9082363.1 hypothetical protein [Paenibacillus sp. CGMCC 1.18879]MBY9085333.1 hypothetical protein [Paenibacillus sinensis]